MSTITHPLTPPSPKFKFSPALVISGLLLIALIAVLAFSYKKAGNANARVTDAQAALQQARAQTDSLQNQVDQARAAQASFQKQLEAAKAESTQMQTKLDESVAREADLQKDIDAGKSTANRIQTQYDAAMARIEKQDVETRSATTDLQKKLDQALADATAQREDADHAKQLAADTQAKLDAAEAQLRELQGSKRKK